MTNEFQYLADTVLVAVVLCGPDQVTYVVWIELTVSGQTVQKSLDVRSEDGVKSCIIYFIQMFSQTVPEVKGDLHDLHGNKERTQRALYWRRYWCCGYFRSSYCGCCSDNVTGVVVIFVPRTAGVLHRSAEAPVSSGLPYPDLDS